MKTHLLIVTLMFTALAAKAQQPKRLRGKAFSDSLMAASKARLDKVMARIDHQADSSKNARAAAKASLDEKNGFRTYHFGDEISKYPGFVKGELDKQTIFYTNPKENLQIGDADLKKISYGFYKGKLYAILIEISGLADSRKVKAAFEAQYGKGYQSNEYIESYWWFGNKVSMSYKENSINHDSTVYISSVEISKQKEEDKKAAAKSAASDL